MWIIQEMDRRAPLRVARDDGVFLICVVCLQWVDSKISITKQAVKSISAPLERGRKILFRLSQ